MTPKEQQQIAEEVQKAEETNVLLEFALDIITEALNTEKEINKCMNESTKSKTVN